MTVRSPSSADSLASLSRTGRRETFHAGHGCLYIALATAAIAAVPAYGDAAPDQMALFAAMALLLLGVPHGGFDVALARRRWRPNAQFVPIHFLFKYIGLAGAVLGLWLLLPELALPLFLAMSAWHFGGDWRRDLEPLPRSVVGAALICFPALWHRQDVIEIFAWLAPIGVARQVAELMAICAVPLAQAAAVVVVLTACRNLLAAGEMLATLLLSALVGPLTFFVIYFCGLHSVRHMSHAYDELQPVSLAEFVRTAVPYAVPAILATLAGGWLLVDLEAGPALLGAVFLALAALSVPHMALVDWFEPKDLHVDHLIQGRQPSALKIAAALSRYAACFSALIRSQVR